MSKLWSILLSPACVRCRCNVLDPHAREQIRLTDKATGIVYYRYMCIPKCSKKSIKGKRPRKIMSSEEAIWAPLLEDCADDLLFHPAPQRPCSAPIPIPVPTPAPLPSPSFCPTRVKRRKRTCCKLHTQFNEFCICGCKRCDNKEKS